MWLNELFSRCDDTVVSAQVHECEEAEEAIIICIEISVLVRLVLRIPETVDEFIADLVIAKKRCCSYSRNKTYRMAENPCPTSCRKDISFLWKASVHAILVNECINTLAVEEILDLLAILPLNLRLF